MTETPLPEPDADVVRHVEFPQAPPAAPEASVQPEVPVPQSRGRHPAARFAAGEISPDQQQAMLDSKVRKFPTQGQTS